MSAPRRRYSQHSTGLDYSTCYRVETDIRSRVRSLLLSRHLKHPPRTPFCSDEIHSNHLDIEVLGQFDFSTAKSVAKYTGREFGHRRAFRPLLDGSLSPSPMMEAPIAKPTSWSTLRASSSAGELGASARLLDQGSSHRLGHIIEDTKVCDTLLTSSPSNEKSFFLFPRRVLQPKQPEMPDSEHDTTKALLASFTGPVFRPDDDARVHEQELNCCPPCPPTEDSQVRSISPKLTLKPKETTRVQYGFNKLGLKIGEVTVCTPKLVSRGSCEHSSLEQMEHHVIPGPQHVPGIYRSETTLKVPEPSHIISNTTVEFSHRLHDYANKMQDFPNTLQDHSDSADTFTVASTLATDQQQPDHSDFTNHTPSPDSVPQVKVISPSLVSGSSRTSGFRHNLLKTSTGVSGSIDPSLPVQPILTAGPVILLDSPVGPSTDSLGARTDTVHTHRTRFLQPLVALKELSKLQAKEHACDDIDRATSHDYSTTISNRLELTQSNVTLAAENQPQDEVKIGWEVSANNHNTLQKSESSVLGLLGEDVETVAIEVAQDTCLSHDSQHDPATESYSRSIAGSLVEAAKTADEYLKRSSIGQEISSLNRPSKTLSRSRLRTGTLHGRAEPTKEVPELDKVRTRESSMSQSENSRISRQDLQPVKEDHTGRHHESLGGGLVRKAVVETPVGLYPSSQDRNKEARQTNTLKTAHPTCKVPTSLENQQKLTKSNDSRFEMHGPLEQVPLNPTDEHEPESTQDKDGSKSVSTWKHTSAWKPFRSVKESSDWARVPTRRSSNRIQITSVSNLRVTSFTPKSTSTTEWKPPRKTSFQTTAAKARDKLRSRSDFGSGTSYSCVLPNPRAGIWRNKSTRPSSTQRAKSVFPDHSDRKRTAHWLRSFLPSPVPYSPRFTEPPSKTLHDTRVARRLGRSNTAPAHSVDELYFDLLPRLNNGEDAVPQTSETIAQTIDDLENLMNEALQIVQQAAERDDMVYLSTFNTPSSNVLKIGQNENIAKRDSYAGAVSQTSERKQYVPKYLQHSELSDVSPSIYSDEESHGSLSSESNSSDSVIFLGEGHESNGPHSPKSILGQAMYNAAPTQEVKLIPTKAVSSVSRDAAYDPKATATLGETHENVFGIQHGTKLKIDLKNNLPVLIPAESSSAPSTRIAVTSAGIGNLCHSVGLAPDGDTRSETFTRHLRTLKSDINHAPVAPQNVSFPIPASAAKGSYVEDHPHVIKHRDPKALPNKREVKEFIRVFHHPPIQTRQSSLALRKVAKHDTQAAAITSGMEIILSNRDPERMTLSSCNSLDGQLETESELDFSTPQAFRTHASMVAQAGGTRHIERFELKDSSGASQPQRHISGRRLRDYPLVFNLRGKSHVSLPKHEGRHGFSLSRSHKRQPVARDWSPIRKRFVAAVACISTALIGIIVGIYAGEVPSIQYYIADLAHFSIQGNVWFYIALAIPTLMFWPLPLLHGRKPYTLAALTIAMPLLFPQALCVSVQRSPYVYKYRIGLLLPRAAMGLALGFANMNFMATLTDLFGASLQSGNPHQELVDEYDVRRHGGGLGVWLGIWTWCSIGSIGIGFLIGSCIINTLSPDWGLYVSIIIIAAVLLLNVITPEVRRSAYRRSVAEVRTSTEVSRRLAKGEVKMHRVQTGPSWWGEEVHHGILLCCSMLRQPGFLVMAFYVAWIYGQIVLVIVLLGSLMSKYYRFTSPVVGATTCAIPIGALLAIPFQKASLFSRDRHHAQRTDSGTFQKQVSWTSHLVRRSIFTLVLPFAGLAYTLSSSGPPIPFIVPIIFAGLIGFLSSLAIAECNGIIMESFDTSDLQPGMTGRPRGASSERTKNKRTNYSSFPRVSAAFAITQSLGFLIASAATGVGGAVQRAIGQQAATGVMAGILLVLTILLLAVLVRWKTVQIIPNSKAGDMDRWEKARRVSVANMKDLEEKGLSKDATELAVAEDEEQWRPVIIGNPSGKTRRMSILELGAMSRWSEIRRKNLLIDEQSLEARHPNLATLGSLKGRLREVNMEVVGSLREQGERLRRGGSQRSARSKLSKRSDSESGTGDLAELRGKGRAHHE